MWIKKLPKKHIVSDGIYFHTDKAEGDVWNISINTEVTDSELNLTYELTDLSGDLTQDILNVAEDSSVITREEAGAGHVMKQVKAQAESPKVWDTKHPNRYLLCVKSWEDGKVTQTENIRGISPAGV